MSTIQNGFLPLPPECVYSGTCFFESTHSSKGPVPEEETLILFGKADVKRPGADVTVVAVSRMAGEAIAEAIAAAESLASDGISIDVIDPRTLVPLDTDSVLASVKKTARLVTAEDSCVTCGVGAEIVARVIERAMDFLENVVRIVCPDIPAPFSPPLQSAYLPGKETIVKTVRGIVK